MSTHINAQKGQIAEKVILPGDPLRAKFIAENFLENVECYNTVRNMFGFTGTYKGKRVSVQGTGMGMPSIGIYAYELINDFGCKSLIRTGTCGSFLSSFTLGDLIIAQAAASDSSAQRIRFGQEVSFPAVADFSLLRQTVEKAEELKLNFKVGTVVSSDLFYMDDDTEYQKLIKFGVCAAEMECAELFTLGARFGVRTLGVLTVSDMIYENKSASAEEREKSFTSMMKLALEAI